MASALIIMGDTEQSYIAKHLGNVRQTYPDAVLENGTIRFTSDGFKVRLTPNKYSIIVSIYIFNRHDGHSRLNDVNAALNTLIDPNGDVSIYMLISPKCGRTSLTKTVNALKAHAKAFLIDRVISLFEV